VIRWAKKLRHLPCGKCLIRIFNKEDSSMLNTIRIKAITSVISYSRIHGSLGYLTPVEFKALSLAK
jgi:hypothetical protein